VPSCLAHKVWDKTFDPFIVRGGSNGTEVTWVTEIPEDIKVVRLWWEFYQQEAGRGDKCTIKAVNPKGGIPVLSVVSVKGEQTDRRCYYSRSSTTLKVKDSN
jgi:hypothetical protein